MWGYKDNVYETERANVSKSQKFDLEYDIKCSCCTHRPQKSLNAWIPRQCPSDSNLGEGSKHEVPSLISSTLLSSLNSLSWTLHMVWADPAHPLPNILNAVYTVKQPYKIHIGV